MIKGFYKYFSDIEMKARIFSSWMVLHVDVRDNKFLECIFKNVQ